MGIEKKYSKKKPLVCLTAYDYKTALIVDKYSDIVLVGDSLGMVLYGDNSTGKVTLDMMIRHGKSVRKGIKKSYLVVDMPKNTYNNPVIALKNAKKIIKFTKCDAVKLEGGLKQKKTIRYLINHNIQVVGHIGLLPQSIDNPKNYRVLGKTIKERNKILADFEALEELNVKFIVVEAVTKKLADFICNKSNIPIIGIGASNRCDGQILVTEDLIGYFDKIPKFVKKYSNVKNIIDNSIKKFAKDVRLKKFPFNKNLYN